MSYIGHEEAWATWRRALSGSRMHHGWILAGRRGVGKSAFALAAARELVAEPGVSQPVGEHPDVLYVTHPPKDDKEARKKADGKPYELARNIKIDQIRRLQQRHPVAALGRRAKLGRDSQGVCPRRQVTERAHRPALSTITHGRSVAATERRPRSR